VLNSREMESSKPLFNQSVVRIALSNKESIGRCSAAAEGKDERGTVISDEVRNETVGCAVPLVCFFESAGSLLLFGVTSLHCRMAASSCSS
jgi:hypothetical protein